MALIRSAFQDELDGVSQSLVDLTNMVSESIVKATKSLLSADLNLAEEVIATDVKIDDYQHELDARIIDIIARQQPVASDLRALITALRMSADLERMGDLAHHIGQRRDRRHLRLPALPFARRHFRVAAMVEHELRFGAFGDQFAAHRHQLAQQRQIVYLLRKIARAGRRMHAGMHPTQAMTEAGIRPGYPQQGAESLMRHLGVRRLLRLPEDLVTTDLALKGGSHIGQRTTLERLIVRLGRPRQ